MLSASRITHHNLRELVMSSNQPLDVKYACKSWSDVVAQDDLVASIARLRDRGSLDRRFYWFSGSSGTGKTTMTNLLAEELSSDGMNVREIDANTLTVSMVDKMARSWQTRPLGGGNHVLILNESHGLREKVVTSLLSWYDQITKYGDSVVLIFTTTTQGNVLFEDLFDAAPLKSRCVPCKLSTRNVLPPMLARLLEIAALEGLDSGDVKRDTARMTKQLKAARNNMRECLQWLEFGGLVHD